jgi:hypothetical protein
VAERTVLSEFDGARQRYQQQADAWYTAAEMARDAQARLRAAEQAASDIAVQLRSDPRIGGKTVEARKSEFDLLALKDDEYRHALSDVEEMRREAARWQDEMTKARDLMAMQKRILDFCIAQYNYKAARGGENNDNRR